MDNLQGFWSYVHLDDEAEGGRISQLARDVAAQFEMLTGDKINLFLDQDAIEWGENWREKIDTGLASVGFFVPVLTPRYFLSVECRRELQYFARKATDLGIKELILPLLYVDVVGMSDEPATDELIQLVKTFQWKDWRNLRFSDVKSEDYRRAIAELATRLVEANRKAEVTPVTTEPLVVDALVISEDETPGIIDLLADAEEEFKQAPPTLELITKQIVQISDIMKDATADIQKPESQAAGFTYRRIVFRRLVTQLSEPTEQIWLLSNKVSSQLHSFDKGLRIIFDRAPEEIKNDPSTKPNFCNLIKSIHKMIASSNEALIGFQGMIGGTEQLDKISRDLRPVMRRLRQGLTILVELKGLYQEWADLIDSSGISCEDLEPAN